MMIDPSCLSARLTARPSRLETTRAARAGQPFARGEGGF